MPRTCRACISPERAAIDQALATGESFRNITKRFSISPSALFRHKNPPRYLRGLADSPVDFPCVELLCTTRSLFENPRDTEKQGDNNHRQ